ncbi:single-stranded DNA-binding protein [Helicobacter monodelphidis]|uniref:single-stranded DNA-binding protein n=1 Tax=Helicobacter sp. 15-1451 TaxID=2004995 RepID=UPI000DCC991F|nr:single-stranded DNA-binding protein [Helicobacter sp. 15-1451]RAX57146.1 single-stranded DNA-binding protein [Helicobacter sp. 15-1451]
MYNRIVLLGNLTRDVELRYLPSGSALAKIGLATNRRYKRQDGTPSDEVCFIDVNLFGRTAEVANQYLKKGSKVLIEGRLVYESWTDQSGQKRSRHVVVADSMQMLDGRQTPEDGGAYVGGYDAGSNYSGNSYPQNNYNSTSYQTGNANYVQQQNQSQTQQKKEAYTESKIPEIDINDDDVPF